MTVPDERVRAVAELGRYTERQARFLVTVMRHSGVCVPRQYARFCGIQYGAKTRKFFGKLVRREHASVMECRHNRARLYHVKPRALYRAIGDEECRFRRQMPLSLALQRLMILDAIVESPDVVWLATAEEKAAQLTLLTRMAREELPHITVRQGDAVTVRYFPERLPIGISPDGRGVLAFVVDDPCFDAFRDFLMRHAALLRALPCWTLRLVLPPHAESMPGAAMAVVSEQLLAPVSPRVVEELRWYFEQAQKGHHDESDDRYRRARSTFSTHRWRAVYRGWRHEREAVITTVGSTTLAEMVKAGTGRIEVLHLGHRYAHLSPLASIA
jgi:hypothetical protein